MARGEQTEVIGVTFDDDRIGAVSVVGHLKMERAVLGLREGDGGRLYAGVLDDIEQKLSDGVEQHHLSLSR